MAHQSHASALATVFSYSLESRRHCPSQAKERSTKPAESDGPKAPFLIRCRLGLGCLGLA
jgi:hypothetical protein